MSSFFWTDEEVAKLLRLRAENVDYGDVAIQLNRPRKAVMRKVAQLRAADVRNGRRVAAGLRPRPHQRLWTAEEVARLHHLRDVNGLSFKKIDALLGRTGGASCTKYLVMHPKSRVKAITGPDRVNVAPAEMQDRNARRCAEHRDLTSAFFGDPLPGRSALDQRRGA